MTAPASRASTKDVPFGDCVLVIDEEKELICGKPGVTELIVRNQFGFYVVVLCNHHRVEHRKFYAELRSRQNRPRRHS